MTPYLIAVLSKITLITGFLLIPLVTIVIVVTMNFFDFAINHYGEGVGYKEAWKKYKVPFLASYILLIVTLAIFLLSPVSVCQ